MTNYRLATTDKKSVLQREVWTHTEKGWTATYDNIYRWGSAFVTPVDDEMPDIDLDNEDGIDINDLGHAVEIESLDDGCESNWTFSDDVPEDVQNDVVDGWNNEPYIYMEENGWEMKTTEIWFYGPLELEEV